jgi:hypothetical protein
MEQNGFRESGFERLEAGADRGSPGKYSVFGEKGGERERQVSIVWDKSSVKIA